MSGRGRGWWAPVTALLVAAAAALLIGAFLPVDVAQPGTPVEVSVRVVPPSAANRTPPGPPPRAVLLAADGAVLAEVPLLLPEARYRLPVPDRLARLCLLLPRGWTGDGASLEPVAEPDRAAAPDSGAAVTGHDGVTAPEVEPRPCWKLAERSGSEIVVRRPR